MTGKGVENVIPLIGETPLVRLNGPSEATGCEIYGKCEFLNPGYSVKDRAALHIIRDALERGLVEPGGAVVEGTAGNTGIGLTIIASVLGLKSIIVIPDTQSREKKETLRALGATLVEVPAKPYRNPNNYVKYSARLAEALKDHFPGGAFWANQFDNVANRRAHEETTAQEIWRQTQGKVDAFICAVGTGGTLGGVSDGLKAKNPDIVIGLADPHGAALYSYYTSGELKAEGSSIMEGIGQSRITKNLEGAKVDWACRVSDAEALRVLYDLDLREGMLLGGSSGINVAGAMKLAREIGPGKTIVTMLCDPGLRYMSKLYNPAFLKEKGLPLPPWTQSAAAAELPEVFLPEEEEN